MRAKLESAIGSVLHKNQVWFHVGISREEAERRLYVLGCQNGMFLIREKDPGFVLGLCYEGSVLHYLFDVDQQGRLSIKSGPKFDNLMLAVDHYTQREDGLLCKLRDPCNVELFEGKLRRTSVGTRPRSVADQDLRIAATNRPLSRSFNESNPFASNPFLQGATTSVPDILHGGRWNLLSSIYEKTISISLGWSYTVACNWQRLNGGSSFKCKWNYISQMIQYSPERVPL